MPLFILYLFFTAAAVASGSAHSQPPATVPLQNWVDSFYKDRQFCGTATIHTATIEPGHVLVQLDIDTRWQQAMVNLDPTVRDNWFAVHCPLPISAIDPLLDNRDVIIIDHHQASMPDHGLSCRAFNQQMIDKNIQRKESARTRLSALLDKFGLSRD